MVLLFRPTRSMDVALTTPRRVPILRRLSEFVFLGSRRDEGQTSKREALGKCAGAPIRAQSSGRGGAIRTLGLLNPIQVRYQAAPRPDRLGV